MKKVFTYTLPNNTKITNTNVEVKGNEVNLEVEYEAVFVPKDGDFIVADTSYGTKVVIYNSTNSIGGVVSYAGGYLNRDNITITLSPGWGYTREFTRLATNEEMYAFLQKLKNRGFRWDFVSKKLTWIPKFGDIIRVKIPDSQYNRNYIIGIYPDKDLPEGQCNGFLDIANLDLSGKLSFRCGINTNNLITLASEKERKELFRALEKINKKWNPLTMKLEDARWIPKFGEEYYFVGSDGTVYKAVNCKNTFDTRRIELNNFFREEKDAQVYANEIKGIFSKNNGN